MGFVPISAEEASLPILAAENSRVYLPSFPAGPSSLSGNAPGC